MAAFPEPSTDALLALMAAESRADLLAALLHRTGGLRGVTLWSQEGGDRVPVAWAGEPSGEGTRTQRLGAESDHAVSAVPELEFSPLALAVLELRLLYLEARETNVFLSNQLAALAVTAKTDALTHLPNRHAFEGDLDALDATSTSFAVVFIDLDGFKAINDRFGHALGDSLLKGYAVWLLRVTGPWGRVYRMGGDEYLLLMTQFPGPPEAFTAWAYDRLQVPFVDGVSASIGIAWRHECAAISDVVRLADQRMYQAKAQRAAPERAPQGAGARPKAAADPS
ncbi:diguanylate cyclase (GGDEF)-like protein [Deinococcus budaensis]|uniref:Diguanylate cyclase (GGDEF)-like protein n=1 Tax=Deinococcus budaensis TaxID=1665626 RepID=A0A7W8LQE6_9DEIO|nr:GGDEF domain-containing protein [Deinococcus budaensis]MBB5234649.1 diguanylate cyclase (GGDEF)-like protein [Deinococcus budaensis]